MAISICADTLTDVWLADLKYLHHHGGEQLNLVTTIADPWRLREGAASEPGKEACVTRALVEQVLTLGRTGCICRLADALHADGPLLAWLRCVHGIAALVRLPADRCLSQELEALAAENGLDWHTYHETSTVRGHKARLRVEGAGLDGLTTAAAHGQPEATRWGCLICEEYPATPFQRKT